MHNRGLVPIDILIEACQLGALRFLRDMSLQQGQFCQSLVGVTMPQFPFGAFSGGCKGLTGPPAAITGFFTVRRVPRIMLWTVFAIFFSKNN
jgi:hypothetical protein